MFSWFRKSSVWCKSNLHAPSLKLSPITGPSSFSNLSTLKVQASKVTSLHHMATPTLGLTPGEALLRKSLLDARNRLPEDRRAALVLRFAGGWVRDKLLGEKSHDIDVALSSMTGWEFAEFLKAFFDEHGKRYEEEATKIGIPSELRSLHKIAAQPDKSKHLEAVTTRMFGFDLDFVNLRKEVYTQNSRVPQIEFGTPEEDALRRDATINSLFYNLHTGKVEDFTGLGLKDMRNRIIRTPLPPALTFKDDPLRVLRLIRFAARLDYSIDQTTCEAMLDPEIHEAFKFKISRERVGIEVGKMVSGPDPKRALLLIQTTGLYGTVFADPNPSNPFVPKKDVLDTLPRVYQGLLLLLEINDFDLKDSCTVANILKPRSDRPLAWYLAVYTAWSGYQPNDAVKAATEGIKATNKVTAVLRAAVDKRPMVRELKEVMMKAGGNVPPRAEVGMAIRRLGLSWRWQILYSMLVDFQRNDAEEVIPPYADMLHTIKWLRLEDVTEMKPILDGNELQTALEQQKSGPWMKPALEMVMEWQLNHPAATKEDALEMVAKKRDEFERLIWKKG